MATYIAPVTDRTLSDVQQRRRKAFFNVADWERINSNLSHAIGLVQLAHALIVPQVELDPVDAQSFGIATAINALCANINQLRSSARLADTDGMIVRADYASGGRRVDYAAVNEWERAIDIVVRRYAQIHIMPLALCYAEDSQAQPVVGVSVAGAYRNLNLLFRGRGIYLWHI